MIGLLIALMAQATATPTPTPTPIVAPPCSVEIVGTKEVFVVSYYMHEDPDRRGYRFRMKGLLYTRTDETLTVLPDLNPVAFEWYTRPVGNTDLYTVAKTCGEIPTIAFEEPKASTDPPPPCPLEVTDETELYLKAYYLNQDPLNGGYRYGYRTVSIVVENQTIEAPVEEPVAFEVIEYQGPGETLYLLATCGEIPSEVYPTDPTPTPVPATPTSIPATPTTRPSDTPTATATPSPFPTSTPTLTPTSTPTLTPTPRPTPIFEDDFESGDLTRWAVR